MTACATARRLMVAALSCVASNALAQDILVRKVTNDDPGSMQCTDADELPAARRLHQGKNSRVQACLKSHSPQSPRRPRRYLGLHG